MKQKLVTTTRWVIILTALGWIAYDIIAIWFGGVDATESRQITELAAKSMPVVFGVGFLCGHWFWGQTIIVKVDKDGNPIKDDNESTP